MYLGVDLSLQFFLELTYHKLRNGVVYLGAKQDW